MRLLKQIFLFILSFILLTVSITTFAEKDVQIPSTDELTMNKKCTKAIDTYIKRQKRMKIGTMKVKDGNKISVDYIGRLSDGVVFDTNIRTIAKACNIFTKERQYGKTLDFTVGNGEMIEGFDKGVVGIKLKETKTISIMPSQAYGEKLVTLPIEQLPPKDDGTKYKQGDSIATMNGEIIIQSITDKEFTINNVHPLAGKELIFDVTVKKIYK